MNGAVNGAVFCDGRRGALAPARQSRRGRSRSRGDEGEEDARSKAKDEDARSKGKEVMAKDLIARKAEDINTDGPCGALPCSDAVVVHSFIFR